jgi:hypothetical protein
MGFDRLCHLFSRVWYHQRCFLYAVLVQLHSQTFGILIVEARDMMGG